MAMRHRLLLEQAVRRLSEVLERMVHRYPLL